MTFCTIFLKNISHFFSYTNSIKHIIQITVINTVLWKLFHLYNQQSDLIYFFNYSLQVPRENTVQYPPLPPLITGGIPNSLGLRLEAEPRHFEGGGGLVKIKCIAEVGSRVFEAERRVLMAYVNNQRLSAGDHLHAAACSIRDDCLVPLLMIVVLVLFTTWRRGLM